jgi:hypothetical protein
MESPCDSAAASASGARLEQERARARWELYVRLEVVLSEPAVQALGEQIQEEEGRLGALLSGLYAAETERWERAVCDGDVELFKRICPGVHSSHGRICLLDRGHDVDAALHWGRTADDGCGSSLIQDFRSR